MINKIFIANKLTNFFKKANPESFFKVFVVSFLFDKISYIEKIVGTKNSLDMLDKYIYNLEHNLLTFRKLNKYHSIYAKYDYKIKTLKYYVSNDYIKFADLSIVIEDKKNLIIKEFKIMMYKELEKIINIYALNGKIISNGFYIEDKNGRYPDYDGEFSNVIDIFSDFEVSNIINLDDKIKVYVDKNKKYFVYSRHVSQRNLEVINYVELWRKFIDKKLFYFAMNNPKRYTEKMINDFNEKYNYILKLEYEFFLKNNNIFALIENYLLHIRNKVNDENNIRYHQDLSFIFKAMNKDNKIKLDYFLLHS